MHKFRAAEASREAHAAGRWQSEQLTFDLIETELTRDLVSDDGVYLCPPPGEGWRVLDAHRERFTQWMRRRPVVLLRRRRRRT